MSFISSSCHPGGPIATGDTKEVTRPTVKMHKFLVSFWHEIYAIDAIYMSVLALPTLELT
jgi:hypothetical protein